MDNHLKDAVAAGEGSVKEAAGQVTGNAATGGEGVVQTSVGRCRRPWALKDKGRTAFNGDE